MSPSEQQQLATALKAYDFGGDTTGAAHRDDLVKDIETGNAGGYAYTMTLYWGTSQMHFNMCP